MDVEGKTVLITGAAKRVGRSISLRFAEAGARIVVHYNQSCSEAEDLIARLRAINENDHRLIKRDLADLESLSDVFTEIGRVDVLVNNASVFNMASLGEESAQDVFGQYAVNFLAPMELMKGFHKQSIETGCVINVLDQRIEKVNHSGGSYPLSKKALADLTLQAASQWAPRLRVNAVAPGPVLPPVGLEGSEMTLELGNVPLEKPVDLNDLTNACLFLVENESITGQILFVDCGQHLTGPR